MPVFPLSTLGPTITDAGITAPPLEDIISSQQASYRNIYGQDVDLSDDTQDGELIVIRSQAIADTNDKIITVFNGFQPVNAQGANLSSLVKINGLQREAASFSTAPILLIGQVGVRIFGGILKDQFGNQWSLPSIVDIPSNGQIETTITCSSPGAITLPEGSTTISDPPTLTFVTPTPGWQSATTTSDASVGQPVETDASLRRRQSVSTSLPATTPLSSTLAAVANVTGVSAYAIYENDTNSTDARGLPPHSISVVVEGGTVDDIAQVISYKKTLGTGTFGTTTAVVLDPSGVPQTIHYYILDTVPAYFVLGLHPLTGYLSSTGDIAIAAVAEALNSLLIGDNAYVNKLFGAANLMGDAALIAAEAILGQSVTQTQLDALSATYNITYIHLGTAPSPPTQADIVVNFHQQVVSDIANGSITLT